MESKKSTFCGVLPHQIQGQNLPPKMVKFGCFELKTPKNGGGAMGRKKRGGLLYIMDLTEVGKIKEMPRLITLNRGGCIRNEHLGKSFNQRSCL